jgi:hypothetical protein
MTYTGKSLDDIVNGCIDRVWYRSVENDEFLGSAATMLSDGERLMLHWLAREFPFAAGGVIVDAGCFLGGSTLALATGLAKHQHCARKGYRIHSYDMFVAPNDGFSLGLIGHGRCPGDTVLDLYARNLGALQPLVMVHAGDIMEAPAPNGATEILFIDIAKTRKLNAKVLLDFFPMLVPGRSILIQQDHNDQSCSWVNSTMEFLSGYFDRLCDEGASRVFLNTRAIPENVLRDAAFGLSLDDEFDLMSALVAREQNHISRFCSAVSKAWVIFERDDASSAISYLDAWPYEQPWEGASYIEFVKASIRAAKDNAGLERYHEGYFKGAR